MRDISDTDKDAAWTALKSDFKWVKEQLGIIAIGRQQIGGESYYIFHFGAEDYLEMPVEETLSQTLFRKRIYAVTGYPCPKQTSENWDKFCALIYMASGNAKILDTKTAEIEELLGMYLQGPHTTEVPIDDDDTALRESLKQVQAGVLRAIWYDSRWIFRIDDMLNFARKNWQDIKRPDLVQKLNALGFENRRTNYGRFWQSPHGFGSSSVTGVTE